MLTVSNVQAGYNKNIILDDVNITTNAGELVSIIGKSGAGKTSLFKVINGSLKPFAGSVTITSTDSKESYTITELKGKNKRKVQRLIGTIYQDFCLVENMSLIQNVLNGGLVSINALKGSLGLFSKEQREYAEWCIEKVGLKDKRSSMVINLSGGEKQRVAIARAIMQRPAIILADEPVASLDPYTAEQIMELLTDLTDELKLSILMNSHNIDVAVKYSSKIYGLKDKSACQITCEYGTFESLKEQLKEIYQDS